MRPFAKMQSDVDHGDGEDQGVRGHGDGEDQGVWGHGDGEDHGVRGHGDGEDHGVRGHGDGEDQGVRGHGQGLGNEGGVPQDHGQGLGKQVLGGGVPQDSVLDQGVVDHEEGNDPVENQNVRIQSQCLWLRSTPLCIPSPRDSGFLSICKGLDSKGFAPGPAPFAMKSLKYWARKREEESNCFRFIPFGKF
ncbi:hypothetical protein LEMLEM_LOCUS958 [Lemmus lemmus]